MKRFKINYSNSNLEAEEIEYFNSLLRDVEEIYKKDSTDEFMDIMIKLLGFGTYTLQAYGYTDTTFYDEICDEFQNNCSIEFLLNNKN